MNKFGKDFDDFDKEISKGFRFAGLMGCGLVVFQGLLSLAVIGGIGWVVYVLLKHFGIVG